ncbi:hypothetical protein [Halorussus aquaticus]|uniref:Sulfatase n=1 Tax=Halorussus aquaticus TaxID=2953748 RepID=A0ABD5PZ41_9EURY|nr:hypothetical protein [Halorussus aquaticus]
MLSECRTGLQLLEEHARNPKKGMLAANLLYYKLKERVSGGVDGVDVLAEDWDNLIILDACRYDAFSRVVPEYPEIRGELESRRSKAPYTREFLRKTFDGQKLYDSVYVTANPQLYELDDSDDDPIDAEFHATVHSFLADYDLSVSKAIRGGYVPEHTTETAKRAAEDFPDKRLVVHYLPPHWPFFGERGQELFEGIDNAPWDELTSGELEIPREDLWDAYVENLRIALDAVSDLLPALEGKTVITADHGQLLGDLVTPFPVRGYGHPGVHIDALLEVPWFVCEHDTRKQVVAESPVGAPYPDLQPDDAGERAKQTLRDLGYVPE